MTNILRAVIQGLEVTFENNGLGGMASTFQLLEIAHTYFWFKDNKADLSPMSERSSPLNGSRESLASIDPNSTTTNLPAPEPPATNLNSPNAGLVAQLGKSPPLSVRLVSRSFRKFMARIEISFSEKLRHGDARRNSLRTECRTSDESETFLFSSRSVSFSTDCQSVVHRRTDDE